MSQFRLILDDDKDDKDKKEEKDKEKNEEEDATSSQGSNNKKSTETSPSSETLDPEKIRQMRLNRFKSGNSNSDDNAERSPKQQQGNPNNNFPILNIFQQRTDQKQVGSDSLTKVEAIDTKNQEKPVGLQTPKTPIKAENSSSYSDAFSFSPLNNSTMIENANTSNSSNSGLGGSGSASKPPMSIEKFYHLAVENIFEICLHPSRKKKDSYLVLKNFPIQLTSDNQKLSADIFFTEDTVEAGIVEKLSSPDLEDPLIYLLQCSRRVNSDISKENGRKEPDSKRIEKLQSLKELCAFYFSLLIGNDCYFPNIQNKTGPLKILRLLLVTDTESTSFVPQDFLGLVVTKLPSQRAVEACFEEVLQDLNYRMKAMTLLDKYTPVLHALMKLTSIPEICQVLVNMPLFLGEDNTSGIEGRNGAFMEKETFLGPFFRLTTFYDYFSMVVGDTLFKGIATLLVHELQDIKLNVRMEINLMHADLHKIMFNLLKNKDISKKPTLTWIAYAIEGNKTRAMMRENFEQCSSDGFLLNLNAVLLRLCEPFVIKGDTSLHQISPAFSMTKLIIDFRSETKTCANTQQVEQYAKENEKDLDGVTKPFNFVTEIFFYTYRCLQIGLLKSFLHYRNLLKPWNDAYAKYELTKSPKELEEYHKLCVAKWSAEIVLMDFDILGNALSFYSYASKWLMYVADPEGKGLPLDKTSVPKNFSILNEYYIETIEDFLLTLARFVPKRLDGADVRDIVNMLVYFMDNNEYLVNPYIRAKGPEVLSQLIPYDDGKNSINAELLNSAILKNPVTEFHLIPAMVKLYVDLEKTGSSNQFYDKFNPRYYMAVLLKYIWKFGVFKNSLIDMAKSAELLRFLNMVLNDAIFLLDESMKHLHRIHELGSSLSPLTADAEQELANSQRQVSSYLLLANETVHMLSYLSKDAAEPFLRKEMIARVASMLNYFLVELAGAKCQNLKVDHPEKYHFDAKYLLTEITDTYVNLSIYPEFVEAVASEERSYDKNVFIRTENILRKIQKRSESYIQEFDDFLKQVEEKHQSLKVIEEDLGEIPDDFLDPITYTLMEDPVLLPTSNHSVDRKTIERHLLNDQTDPFNRKPLSPDMLVPDTKLAEEIAKWKNSKKQK